MSLRLKDDQMERLRRTARRLGRKPSETAALLLEEALRQSEFALIEFRDSPAGRQAYLRGTRLTVWQVTKLVRAFSGDADQTAAHLEVPATLVRAARAYAAAYPEEIEAAIEDADRSLEELQRLIPNLTVVEVHATPA
ncbi:MAG: transcriptional regulator [Dehalococcoidia bacterium]